jgi:hypothetical protein
MRTIEVLTPVAKFNPVRFSSTDLRVARNSLYLNGLVLTKKTANTFANPSAHFVGTGIVLGVIVGSFTGFLYGLGILNSAEMQSLFFSSSFFNLMGAKEVLSYTLSGSITGILLGAVIGSLSSIEVPE